MLTNLIDNRQLEAIYWIARLGSFASAARKLNTSQPAITKRVSDLESRLGVNLFDRSRRRAVLTPQGQEVVDTAERILSTVADLQQKLTQPEVLSGTLRIGVNETVALSWLPRLMQLVKDALPKIALEVHVGLTQELWTKYQNGNLELLLVSGPIEDERAIQESLGSTEYVWMAAPETGLTQSSLTRFDVENLPIITHGPGSTMHDDILNWLQQDAKRIQKGNVCHSLSAMAALTVAGVGLSPLPPLIFQDEIKAGRLIALDPVPAFAPVEFWAVYPNRAVSPLPAAVSRYAMEASTFDK